MPSSVTGFLTGGLIDPKTPDYAGLAAKNEAEREAIINLGLEQINAVFGGGSAPFYEQAGKGAAYDPTANYFTLGSGGFTPYGKPGQLPSSGNQGGLSSLINDYGKGSLLTGPIGAIDPGANIVTGGIFSALFGKKPDSPLQRFQKKENAGAIYEGSNQSFQGFTPAFYQQRAQDYINYALPQLQQQHKSTRQGVEFGLANRGLYGPSSARKSLVSEVEREYGQGAQTIADTAQSQGQQLQSQVENARQSAISQLYQTADPAQATSGAIAAASQFSIPQTFVPLSNMFSNLLTNYYTNQLLSGTQQPQYILPGSQYNISGQALPPVSYP